MEKDILRLHQRMAKGQCCTQILVSLGLDLLGEENDRMVQAVSGLCRGVQSGLLCGALTGAALMLSLFDEKMAAEEMIPELVEWFQGEYGEAYGGTDCDTILEGFPGNKTMRCPKLIESAYREAKEILEDFGFDIEGMAREAF